MTTEKPKMVPVEESIVGTLVVRGIIRPEDAERARQIVDEELRGP